MMQTLLTNSPAAPTAAAADKSAVLTASQDGGEGALQSDGKVGFSEVMNRVQQADKVNAKADGKAPARPGAEQGNVGAAESNKPVPTAKGEAAKSLANEAEEAGNADDKPQKGSEPVVASSRCWKPSGICWLSTKRTIWSGAKKRRAVPMRWSKRWPNRYRACCC